MADDGQILEYGRFVLRAEAQAVASQAERLGAEFARAVRMILDCKGLVVATGMGKAGFVAQKVSATLASTATPSIYIHPAEAYHGDLGRIGPEDLVLAFSNSGETDEVVRLIPRIREIGAKILALASRADSSLGKAADVTLAIGKIEEPCPLRLAPSASTTAMLALGDALALTVLKERGVDERRYALYHPGGQIGRSLLRVEELMRTGDRFPVAEENTGVLDAVARITSARAGAICVVDAAGRLSGIFTDGDFRRLVAGGTDLKVARLGDHMTRKPLSIPAGRAAREAAELMGRRKVNQVPVVDVEGRPIGILDIQDLVALRVEA